MSSESTHAAEAEREDRRGPAGRTGADRAARQKAMSADMRTEVGQRERGGVDEAQGEDRNAEWTTSSQDMLEREGACGAHESHGRVNPQIGRAPFRPARRARRAR